MKTIRNLVSTLLLITVLALQAKSQLAFNAYYGASSPLGDYKEKPISNARNGYSYGFAANYTFMESNLGLGLDIRYSKHPHQAPDTVYSRQATHIIIESNTANSYSSPLRFGQLGIFLGPTYRIGEGRLGIELYAKGGLTFEEFPSYVTRETTKTSFPTLPGAAPHTTQRDLLRTTSDRAKSWAAIFGARVDLEILPNVGLFVYGDYQTPIGNEGSFTVENLQNNEPPQKVLIKMASFGGGIRFSIGSGREYGTIRDNY